MPNWSLTWELQTDVPFSSTSEKLAELFALRFPDSLTATHLGEGERGGRDLGGDGYERLKEKFSNGGGGYISRRCAPRYLVSFKNVLKPTEHHPPFPSQIKVFFHKDSLEAMQVAFESFIVASGAAFGCMDSSEGMGRRHMDRSKGWHYRGRDVQVDTLPGLYWKTFLGKQLLPRVDLRLVKSMLFCSRPLASGVMLQLTEDLPHPNVEVEAPFILALGSERFFSLRKA